MVAFIYPLASNKNQNGKYLCLCLLKAPNATRINNWFQQQWFLEMKHYTLYIIYFAGPRIQINGDTSTVERSPSYRWVSKTKLVFVNDPKSSKNSWITKFQLISSFLSLHLLDKFKTAQMFGKANFCCNLYLIWLGFKKYFALQKEERKSIVCG